jgi:hypothetical protein
LDGPDHHALLGAGGLPAQDEFDSGSLSSALNARRVNEPIPRNANEERISD